MTNLTADPIFAPLTVKATDSVPLYQQVYERLRTAILIGQIAPGTRIPSTRVLADALGVSRNTVMNAYDQLAAEGYIVSKEGSGTVVAPVLPEMLLSVGSLHTRDDGIPSSADQGLSQRGRDYLYARGMPGNFGLETQKAFQVGMPALDAFPYELWNRCVTRRARYTDPNLYSYQNAAGYRPLREAIASHLSVARGVRCTADQVIVVSGSQGALDLAARVLLDPGDPVWIEDPGYLGARGALIGAGAKLIPVSVDAEGIDVATGIRQCPEARLAYVTPSHQFPLAVTMSLSRRLALLDWAARSGSWILEDDYNSEYRYSGRPLAALQGLDTANRVIYIGTFSKVMFPAMRIGYVVVPESLVDAFLAARRFIDVHSPLLEQAALADFMEEGHLTRHIRRMRTLYAERRALLVELAERDLPLDLYAPEAGMHLVGWLPEGIDDQEASQQARLQDVYATPISVFSIMPLPRKGLVLGYASVPDSEIRRGVSRLAQALDTM